MSEGAKMLWVAAHPDPTAAPQDFDAIHAFTSVGARVSVTDRTSTECHDEGNDFQASIEMKGNTDE